jgi:hypothetical protein
MCEKITEIKKCESIKKDEERSSDTKSRWGKKDVPRDGETSLLLVIKTACTLVVDGMKKVVEKI